MDKEPKSHFAPLPERLRRRAELMGESRFATGEELESRSLADSRVTPTKRRGQVMTLAHAQADEGRSPSGQTS